MSDDDERARGYEDARAAHASGVDVTTHRSQGTSNYDEGWNAYVDEEEVDDSELPQKARKMWS